MSDDAWKGSYDAWKTHNPDDDYWDGAARAALVAGGLSDGAATTAITLIAGRKVPGVSISY